jgi:ABC-type phosphate transport system permease subunit
MRDVFEVTPPMLKESAYGLGATTWEVVSKVVLPYTKAASSAASCWAWGARWARPWP